MLFYTLFLNAYNHSSNIFSKKGFWYVWSALQLGLIICFEPEVEPKHFPPTLLSTHFINCCGSFVTEPWSETC